MADEVLELCLTVPKRTAKNKKPNLKTAFPTSSRWGVFKLGMSALYEGSGSNTLEEEDNNLKREPKIDMI